MPPPLDDAITDSDRLNYLEQTRQPLHIVFSSELQIEQHLDGSISSTYAFLGWCVGLNSSEHLTVREAIDAAMRLHKTS